MIFGVGTDIVAVARLGKLYERHGFHVLKKQKNSCTMLLELT